MHGLDFGGYTEWKRPEQSPQPIDFVVAGVAWGKNKNTTYDANLPELRKEKRLMTYGFYNGEQNWLDQVKLWARLSLNAGSKAIWLDYERSSYSVLSDNPQRHATRANNMVSWLLEHFDGKVGVYSNFNDYVVYLQNWVDASKWDWWVAWPDENSDNHPGTTSWWGKVKRERNDYILDQYSWKGYAPDYGAVNDKKSMDLNVVNPNVDLDVWLGLGEEPEPDPPFVKDYEDGWNDALARAGKELEDLIK